MGNLIIKKVSYSGEKYYFESPELQSGLNIIVGDNGSGKSTFSYFIEYGLGGNIKYFKPNNEDEYKLITEDSNNFILLEIVINGEDYLFKRFIGQNDIFIQEKNEVLRLSINRNGQSSDILFSDWLLDKLEIKVFELNLGTYSWLINFNDLFRLLNYDQDTEASRIFKSPPSENFITDSVIVRKSIFETLIGLSSQEYNVKYGELKQASRNKDEAHSLLNNFISMYPNLTENVEEVNAYVEELKEQLEKLYVGRDSYQQKNTNVDEKIENIGNIQADLINAELRISEDSARRQNYIIERNKVEKLLKDQNNEISQIEKIIFTHDKLNLFSLEICPFCGSDEIEPKEEFCICGSKFKNNDYEKFVYKSSEYKEIISHKKKSLQTIEIALDSYTEQIAELDQNIISNTQKATLTKEELTQIIRKIEFSGNSQFIDQFNNKIIEVKGILLENEQLLDLLKKKDKLESDFNSKKITYDGIHKEFQTIKIAFDNNNINTIKNFNSIYNALMSKSSCKSKLAVIDEDYVPVIDGGVYREKSARVPIRLMYYFTFFSMGLKFKNVKHPHFLLIDTPESEGIDEDNLKENILLFDEALKLSEIKNNDYQVILTTGFGKYPNEYDEFVRLTFNTKEKNYILKEKTEEFQSDPAQS